MEGVYSRYRRSNSLFIDFLLFFFAIHPSKQVLCLIQTSVTDRGFLEGQYCKSPATEKGLSVRRDIRCSLCNHFENISRFFFMCLLKLQCAFPPWGRLLLAIYINSRAAVPMGGRRQRFTCTNMHTRAIWLCKQRIERAQCEQTHRVREIPHKFLLQFSITL